MASLRRLAKDHSTLQSALPPNYLYPDTEDSSDDLTQLIVLVTGAEGTPYSQGLWHLHLKIPTDYPTSPPKATFKTRIYHPNVDEKTGAVCLETLKRDWDPKLTLKDILITISCLLIQPNPDSALNASAGALIQEDYNQFSRQAQLMTKIHAAIPRHLSEAVHEAKRRGDEVENKATEQHAPALADLPDDTKENNPSGGSSDSLAYTKGGKGKRPLSEIPLPEELGNESPTEQTSEPKKKSPRTTRDASDSTIWSDTIKISDTVALRVDDEAKATDTAVRSSLAVGSGTLRKPSKMGAARSKQPRVGIRRL